MVRHLSPEQCYQHLLFGLVSRTVNGQDTPPIQETFGNAIRDFLQREVALIVNCMRQGFTAQESLGLLEANLRGHHEEARIVFALRAATYMVETDTSLEAS